MPDSIEGFQYVKTAKVPPKSLKEYNQDSVRKARSPVDRPLRTTTTTTITNNYVPILEIIIDTAIITVPKVNLTFTNWLICLIYSLCCHHDTTWVSTLSPLPPLSTITTIRSFPWVR